MARRQGEDKILVVHRDLRHPRHVGRQRDHRRVDRIVAQSFEQRARPVFDHSHRQSRNMFTQSAQHSRQDIRRDSRDQTQSESTCHRLGDSRSGVGERVNGVDGEHGLGQQGISLVRQEDSPGRPLDQFDPQSGLQGRECLGERRLTDTETGCRRAEMASLGDGRKGLESGDGRLITLIGHTYHLSATHHVSFSPVLGHDGSVRTDASAHIEDLKISHL